MSAAPESSLLREVLVECPAERQERSRVEPMTRHRVRRADRVATCASLTLTRVASRGALSGRTSGADLRLATLAHHRVRRRRSAVGAQRASPRLSGTVRRQHPARPRLPFASRCGPGSGADSLRDLRQRVPRSEPDPVEERIADEELAAAVVGIAAVAVRARRAHEAVVARVVGALGRVDVAAVTPLVGLHAARGQLDSRPAARPRPAVLAGFVIGRQRASLSGSLWSSSRAPSPSPRARGVEQPTIPPHIPLLLRSTG